MIGATISLSGWRLDLPGSRRVVRVRSIMLKVGIVLMCLGPMVPLHLQPWASFHADAMAILGFGVVSVAWLLRRAPSAWSPFAQAAIAVAAVPLLQAAGGIIYFWGDAWMATAYLALFALSVVIGLTLTEEHADVVPFAAGTVLLAAILSVGIAFDQWLQLRGLGGFASIMRQGARPFGNLGQPNQFATFVVLGLVAAHVLYQLRLLGVASLMLTTAFLGWGIAMSQSRTAWLELVVAVVVAALLHKRAGLRRSVALLSLAALIVVTVSMSWPSINRSLYLSSSRSLEQQAEGGVRLIHWATVLDAVGRRPWLGYGWNQSSVAQAKTAAEHTVSEEQIDHSHNIAIDLLAWNGVPLGMAIILGVAWWLRQRFRRSTTPLAAAGLMAIAVLLVHGLLEYPLEYAYFLLPLGLVVGALGRADAPRLERRVGWWWNLALTAAVALLAGLIVADYLEIEDNNRTLRFEMAGYKSDGPPSQAPDVILLTQRREILRFARTTATLGMSAEQLDWMRKISERFGYPPVLLRYAIAAGLNGHPQAAERALATLCKTSVRDQCEEGVQAWATMSAGRYPELARVKTPAIPPARRPQAETARLP